MDGCSLNQLGPRTERENAREGETEGERTGEVGGELNCRDYFYSVARFFFFFPAAIIPFSSTAGQKESLQFAEYMMAQLSLLSPES